MRKSHRCAGLGLIPPAVPGAPAGWRSILKAGAQCVGACMGTTGFIASELQRQERERAQALADVISDMQDDARLSLRVSAGLMTIGEAAQSKQARQAARVAEREAYRAELQRAAAERQALEAAAVVAAAREKGIARARAELANHAPPHAPIGTPPPPAPAIDLKPTKKPGDDWTPADYAELLRQYESLTTGKGAMKGESAREALGKAWSYAPNSIKPFLTTARKQRTPTT